VAKKRKAPNSELIALLSRGDESIEEIEHQQHAENDDNDSVSARKFRFLHRVTRGLENPVDTPSRNHDAQNQFCASNHCVSPVRVFLQFEGHLPYYYTIFNIKMSIDKIPLFIRLFGFSNTLSWHLPTFAIKTIMGTSGLNCSVRNGKRCISAVEAPGHYIRELTNTENSIAFSLNQNL